MTKQKKTKAEKDLARIDLALIKKALKKPGASIPKQVTKALAKEARRQSRMLRDDPQEQELLEAWEEIADRTDWKC